LVEVGSCGVGNYKGRNEKGEVRDCGLVVDTWPLFFAVGLLPCWALLRVPPAPL